MLFSGQAETNNKFDKNKLDYLFPLKQSESRVDFVRIATYIDGLSNSYEVAKQLTTQGYEVSINLMQIQNADQKTIEDFGSSGKELNLKASILQIVSDVGFPCEKYSWYDEVFFWGEVEYTHTITSSYFY